MEAIRRPTEKNQNSLHNLIHHTAGVAAMESEWIQEGPDLAALAHDHEYGWFNGFLEDVLNNISRKLTKVCPSTLMLERMNSDHLSLTLR